MSIARLAMRVAAARAIRDATLAEDRVYDSAIDPIDHAVLENRQPFIVVSTEDHDVAVIGRDMVHGDHDCTLLIETAVASRVAVEGDTGLTIPHTDEGMELVLDILEHQIIAALTREHTAWSRVFMHLVPVIKARKSRRGASAEGGVRFAARQIAITCDLIEAPVAGAAIPNGGTWGDMMTVMSEDEDLAPIGELLRGIIEGDDMADWRRAANTLGIHQSTANALGIGPVLDLADDPESLAEKAMAGDYLSVDAGEPEIEEQLPDGNP
jgi:hypothetical protein